MNVGELPPTHKTVFVLRFKGTSTMFFPQTVYDSRWHRQLMGWLASLTLEDEVRQDLDLPRVVCEYEDVLPDELPGLPP